MGGRKRKVNPAIPKHIDQSRLPAGIYFDASGGGRWYVRAARLDEPTRIKATTVARHKDEAGRVIGRGRKALLDQPHQHHGLHAIRHMGDGADGTRARLLFNHLASRA